MKYRRDARLDTSQIQDQRNGTGGAPGGGLGAGLGGGGARAGRSMGVYLAAGGGTVGLIAVLLVTLLDSLGGGVSTGATAGQSAGQSVGQTTSQAGAVNLAASCKTGADANEKADCRTVAAVNSVQAYWAGAVDGYRRAPTVFFDGSVRTACGSATSAVGPFYCPGDQTVYIDLGFYDQLRRDFGAQGGTFAEAYVIAHEYGHHVQHLVGYDQRVGRDRQGPQSGAVRLELQADCFAGAWAANAEDTGFIEPLTRADVEDGLNAAAAIGDDRIQSAAGGRVSPESFTHGTSEQRMRWFTVGYSSGDPTRCDTWSSAL